MEQEHKIDIEIKAEVVDDGKPEVRQKKESKTPVLTIVFLVSLVTFAVTFKADAGTVACVSGCVLFVTICIAIRNFLEEAT